jgi:hypothetical protein
MTKHNDKRIASKSKTGKPRDSDSIHTEKFKPFTINIKFNKETKVGKILNRKIKREKNFRIIIFTVDYKSNIDKDNFNWDIYKTYQEVQNLFYLIKITFSDFDLPQNQIFPNNKEILRNIDYILNISDDSDLIKVQNLRIIVQLINSLAEFPLIRDKIFFLEFIEISRHSFDCFNDGNKPKEGYVLKKSLSKNDNSCFKKICCFRQKWKKCWFVVKDDMVCYLDNSSSDIGKEVYNIIILDILVRSRIECKQRL